MSCSGVIWKDWPNDTVASSTSPIFSFLCIMVAASPGQIDSRLSEQAELGKVFIVIIYSQPLPYIDQHRIAGIHHSLKECFTSVSSHFMAAYFSVFHNPEARTGKIIGQLLLPRPPDRPQPSRF